MGLEEKMTGREAVVLYTPQQHEGRLRTLLNLQES